MSWQKIIALCCSEFEIPTWSLGISYIRNEHIGHASKGNVVQHLCSSVSLMNFHLSYIWIKSFYPNTSHYYSITIFSFPECTKKKLISEWVSASVLVNHEIISDFLKHSMAIQQFMHSNFFLIDQLLQMDFTCHLRNWELWRPASTLL